MILMNKNFDLNVQIVRIDSKGGWILLNMKVDEKEIWLINLYGPNQDDPHFFENIYPNLLNLQATNDLIIMVAVLSTSKLSTSMNRKGNHSTNFYHCALNEITNIMDTLEIVDIWRLKNPNLVRYTRRRLNQASRLSCVFLSCIKDFKSFNRRQNAIGSSSNWPSHNSHRVSMWTGILDI
jgi:hypothetical protein